MSGAPVSVVHLIAKPLPPPPGSGGANRLVDWLAQAQHQAGNTVTVCSPAGHTTQHFQHVATPADIDPAALVGNLPSGTDIVHHHGGFGTYLQAIMQAGIPVIETVHGNEDIAALNQSAALPTSPVFVSACHMRLHGGTVFVYNGIRLQDFTPRQQKADYLLFLANVRRSKKGVGDAIHIARSTGHKLIIAGGRKFKYLHTWLPLSRNITAVGRVEGEQKKNLLENAQALLVPIRWDEPFGLTVVEAMACGTPVIAANRGAMSELIVDGETGFLCDSIDAMKLAIERTRHINADACRERAEQMFAIETTRDNYQALYRKRIAGEAW